MLKIVDTPLNVHLMSYGQIKKIKDYVYKLTLDLFFFLMMIILFATINAGASIILARVLRCSSEQNKVSSWGTAVLIR